MEQSLTSQVTVSAPVNIAIIKYWGKRNVKLNLPTNSSISITLDQNDLKSTTSVAYSDKFDDPEDQICLNGKLQPIVNRMKICLQQLREQRSKIEQSDSSLPKVSSLPLRIASVNNFPTAAGLASSASGFAALVYAIANLYKLTEYLSNSDLSIISRQGSGSACRSLFGGFVAWQMGQDDESGQDSLAIQIAEKSHWENMSALICVVSDAQKGTPSTTGMQATVATSELIKHRIAVTVPERMSKMTRAIHDKDFDSFAKMTIQDSNQFHAVCMDTEPPIFYLNDVSKAIINLITEYNNHSINSGQGYKAAYTFDAGPNAVIYTLKENVQEIKALIVQHFPQSPGQSVQDDGSSMSEPAFKSQSKVWPVGSVQRLICTSIGDGPRVLSDSESLLRNDGQFRDN